MDTLTSSLQTKIKVMESTLKQTKSMLHYQEVKSSNINSVLRSRLIEKDAIIKQIRRDCDRQIAGIISHLFYLEGQLRKEQKEIIVTLTEKDTLIDEQQQKIISLHETNNNLVIKLNSLHSRIGSNGTLSEPKIGDEIIGDYNGGKPKEKNAKKSRFNSMRDKLRKHKSSLELSTNYAEHKEFLYCSEENLNMPENVNLHNKRHQMRRDRCKSFAGYPIDLQELAALQSSPDEEVSGGILSNGIDHDPNSNSEENDKLHSLPVNGFHEPGSPTAYKTKDRQRSISSIKAPILEEPDQDSPDLNQNTDISQHTTIITETNPFKSLKTILKRKGSKLKGKKRSVSLPQTSNQEYIKQLSLRKKDKT